MNQTRMESRRSQFKIGNVGGQQTSQEKRRLEHLQIQRKRRSNAFDSIRGIDDLAFCSLNDEDSKEKSESSEGRYEDAIEEEDESYQTRRANDSSTNIEEPNSTNTNNNNNNNKKVENFIKNKQDDGHNNKYWKYRDRCMRGEFLELSDGLPSAFDQDWLLLGPIPVGKRCLALTLPNDQNRYPFNVKSNHDKNTNIVTLLSRKKANLIGRFSSILPINSILDCIYDQLNQTLWILDILKWKDQAMIDCEAHFRFWWRNAKLSELDMQRIPDSRRILCVPIPVIFNFSKLQVSEMTREMLTCSKIKQTITCIRSNQNTLDQYQEISSKNVLHCIHYQSEGLLFYIKSATYESGDSLLAGWVPLHVTDDQSNHHGVPKLNWLCEREQDTMEE